MSELSTDTSNDRDTRWYVVLKEENPQKWPSEKSLPSMRLRYRSAEILHAKPSVRAFINLSQGAWSILSKRPDAISRQAPKHNENTHTRCPRGDTIRSRHLQHTVSCYAFYHYFCFSVSRPGKVTLARYGTRASGMRFDDYDDGTHYTTRGSRTARGRTHS